jgi:hypothetical protein
VGAEEVGPGERIVPRQAETEIGSLLLGFQPNRSLRSGSSFTLVTTQLRLVTRWYLLSAWAYYIRDSRMNRVERDGR